MNAQTPVKHWYVVHVSTGYEKTVKRHLEDRIQRKGIEDKFGEIMVPTEEVVEMRGGQKRKSSRKFFPGYVLVSMTMDDETWHLVRNVPRVLGFVGGKSENRHLSHKKRPTIYCIEYKKV